jgi:hypothetical protein
VLFDKTVPVDDVLADIHSFNVTGQSSEPFAPPSDEV